MRRNLGHFSVKNEEGSDQHVPSYTEVAEKMTVESVEMCAGNIDAKIFEGNFGIVEDFVKDLIPAYVDYQNLSKYISFDQKLYNEAKLEKFRWTESRLKIQHAQEILHMHLTVKFSCSHRLLKEIISQVTPVSVSAEIPETPAEDTSADEVDI